MLPGVLRTEIQRAAAIVLIKTFFACHLQWARGLRTIRKAPEIKGNMSPDAHCGNFTSSVLSPCETATSGASQRSEAMGLFNFLFILFPPQIGHRDIHCSTRASKVPSSRRPCLWSGNDGLGYLLFVFKLHFQLEIYSILKLCIHSSVSKSVKEITS